nr:MAG TPA: hypothetical protein [Caudoviricetes sp.]
MHRIHCLYFATTRLGRMDILEYSLDSNQKENLTRKLLESGLAKSLD